MIEPPSSDGGRGAEERRVYDGLTTSGRSLPGATTCAGDRIGEKGTLRLSVPLHRMTARAATSLPTALGRGHPRCSPF